MLAHAGNGRAVDPAETGKTPAQPGTEGTRPSRERRHTGPAGVLPVPTQPLEKHRPTPGLPAAGPSRSSARLPRLGLAQRSPEPAGTG
jgi:hypothetical protein